MKIHELKTVFHTLNLLAMATKSQDEDAIQASRHYLKKDIARLEGRSAHCKRMNQQRMEKLYEQ